MDGHNRSRAGLCLVCLDKSSVPITKFKFEGLVREYLIEEYTVADLGLPSGLCGNCSQKLRAYEKLDFNRSLPELPEEYSSMVRFSIPRGGVKCNCFICQSHQTVGLRSRKSRKRRAGRSSLTANSDDRVAQPKRGAAERGMLCFRCFAHIYPGCHHPCTSESSLENIRKIVPQRSLEILATDIIKEKINSDLPLTLATRGKLASFVPLDSNYKKMREQGRKCVSHEVLKRARTAAGISGNAAQKFVQEMRESIQVERGFKDSLVQANRKFASLFHVVEMSPLSGAKFPSFSAVIYSITSIQF